MHSCIEALTFHPLFAAFEETRGKTFVKQCSDFAMRSVLAQLKSAQLSHKRCKRLWRRTICSRLLGGLCSWFARTAARAGWHCLVGRCATSLW